MIGRYEQKSETVKQVNICNKLKRFLLASLLLLVCLYLGYSALYKGYANAWYYQAEFAINAWAKQGEVTSREDYDLALTAIRKAHALDPNYPHYAHINGRILHWGIMSGFEDDTEFMSVRTLYLSAAKRRPMWPDVWLDLATVNNYLDGYNTETQQYLTQAIEAGPYISPVITGSVRILLSNWSELTGSDKQRMFDQFDKSVNQHQLLKELLIYATSIDKQKLLCVQLKFNPKYQAIKSTSSYHRYC